MTPHTMVLAAALVALLCLTCAVLRSQVVVLRPRSHAAGPRLVVLRRAWAAGPRLVVLRRAWARRARLDASLLRVIDARLAGVVVERAVGACGCGMGERIDSWPTIEQVVAELRRLDRVRPREGESGVWAAAIERAYDRWLQVACHYLAVSHHLFALKDMDREIERLRIETELTEAGLPFRA